MEAEQYNVTCSMCLEGDEEVSEMEWTIPDLALLLTDQSNREFTYRTDAANSEGSYCMIQLKIKILGNQNDLIEVYYRTLVSVFLQCSLYSSSRRKYWEDIQSVKLPYQWVEATKWKFSLALNKHRLNNSLKLKFCFRVNVINGDNKTISDEEALNNTSNFGLNTDLEKLLFDPLLSDVTIKSVEGDEIPAHKLLLMTRSDVLKAHFKHDTVESATNIVETPLETEVLKEVLSYIYTDKASKLDQMAAKLLAAADYYQLPGLKGICEKALHKQLTVENAVATLELATLYTATKLKDLTVKFINDGNAKEVIQTQAWKTLQSSDVIKSIYEYSISNN